MERRSFLENMVLRLDTPLPSSVASHFLSLSSFLSFFSSRALLSPTGEEIEKERKNMGRKERRGM